MNLAKIRFEAAQKAFNFFYKKQNYRITLNRIYCEFDKLKPVGILMNDFFNERMDEIKDDFKLFGAEKSKKNIEILLQNNQDSIATKDNAFIYGVEDSLSVETAINERVFWDYYYCFHREILQNIEAELGDNQFVLDRCVFRGINLSGIPKSERDHFEDEIQEQQNEICVKESLEIYTTCCPANFDIIQRVKYLNPTISDIKLMALNFCPSKLLSGLNTENLKAIIDNLHFQTSKLSNSEIQCHVFEDLINYLKVEITSNIDDLSIPSLKMVSEYCQEISIKAEVKPSLEIKKEVSETLLKAVFFSDIVDSTHYADKDDYLYKELQNINRKIHEGIFSKYNGQIIKDLGDGIMATFSSVKSCVSASVEVIKEVITTNRYQLRIGVHLGDVRIELNDIQGINVNKTFRIQPQANPNTICISEEVYKNIKNVPEFKCTFIGNKDLKGISGEHLLYMVEIENQSGTVIESPFFPLALSHKMNLSEIEIILIKEAILSEKCNIIKVRHQQGLVIQVDEKILFGGDNPRKMAEWEGVFEKLLSDGLINKKGNQSFTLSSKGFEIGDKLVKKSEYGIKYDAQDNAFISLTKIEFFIRRIQDAFPGVRELTWFNNPNDIIDRLEILLRWPLEFYPISKYGKISLFDVPEKPIWWFRGGSKNEIGTFKKLVSDKCLLDSKELKVSNLAVCPNAKDKKSFIYLQIHGEESVFSRNSNISNRETEEYAIFDGHIITREEYDDGSALINGKIISTSGRAEPRYRHLKPYNFILSSNSSDFISNDYNQHLRNFLDSMLLADNIEEIFEDKLESLLELNIISDYYGPE